VDDPQKMLSELARLGARLIIQRAVEEEFDTWLGRARYERRPERQRGLRNGFRPRHVQTAEGELRIEIPQARETAMPFVSKLFPKWHCKRLLRTDPLKALVIGGFVRGLSMRDIESLREEAALGKTSRSTVARICAGLRRSRRVSPPRPWRASATCYAPPPRICRRPISPSRSGSAAPRHSATWRNSPAEARSSCICTTAPPVAPSTSIECRRRAKLPRRIPDLHNRSQNAALGYPSNRSTTVSRDDAFPVMASPPWSFSGVLTSGASFSRAIRLGPVDEGFEAGRAAQLRSNGYPRRGLLG
jgi:hypothetical protein